MALVNRGVNVQAIIVLNMASEAAADTAKTQLETFIANQITAGNLTSDTEVNRKIDVNPNGVTPYLFKARIKFVLTSVAKFLDLRSAIITALNSLDNVASCGFRSDEYWYPEVEEE